MHCLHDESPSNLTIVGINKAIRDAIVDMIVGSRDQVPRRTVNGMHHGKHFLDAIYSLLLFVVRSRTTTTIAHRSRGWDLLPPLQPRAQDPVLLILIRPLDQWQPEMDEAEVDGPGPKKGNRADCVGVPMT